MCPWGSSDGAGEEEEIILKIMLGLVPTRFLFRASAPFFSDIFNRERACVAEAAVSIKALYPAPFLVQKHSAFLFFRSVCLSLRKKKIYIYLRFSKEALHFSCQEDEMLSKIQYPAHSSTFLPLHHTKALHPCNLPVLFCTGI